VPRAAHEVAQRIAKLLQATGDGQRRFRFRPRSRCFALHVARR